MIAPEDPADLRADAGPPAAPRSEEEPPSLRADDPANDSSRPPLSLEVAWPLGVAAGAAGSFLGLVLAWPAFPAAFATLLLWVVLRRARVGGRPVVASLVTLAWVIAVALTVATWAGYASPEEREGPFPGTHLVHALSQGRPWAPFAGAATLASLGVLGARWAEGLFAPWLWALVAGYLGAHAGEAAKALLEAGDDEATAVLRGLALGSLAAVAAAVLFQGFRASLDRRMGWAAGAVLLAGLAVTALGVA